MNDSIKAPWRRCRRLPFNRGRFRRTEGLPLPGPDPHEDRPPQAAPGRGSRRSSSAKARPSSRSTDIVRSMTEKGIDVLATRVDQKKGTRLLDSFPEGTYPEAARCFTIQKDTLDQGERHDPRRLRRDKRYPRCRGGLHGLHLLRQCDGEALRRGCRRHSPPFPQPGP